MVRQRAAGERRVSAVPREEERRERETQMPKMSAEENESNYFMFSRHVFSIF